MSASMVLDICWSPLYACNAITWAGAAQERRYRSHCGDEQALDVPRARFS